MEVYYERVITKVVLARAVVRSLPLVPGHVAIMLQDWIEDVEDRGLAEVRKIPGYHDEPLSGRLRGLRSIRLSKAYRAYYRVVRDTAEFVSVERLDKHVY